VSEELTGHSKQKAATWKQCSCCKVCSNT